MGLTTSRGTLWTLAAGLAALGCGRAHETEAVVGTGRAAFAAVLPAVPVRGSTAAAGVVLHVPHCGRAPVDAVAKALPHVTHTREASVRSAGWGLTSSDAPLSLSSLAVHESVSV